MKLTSRSEYALLALVHLARRRETEFLTVSAIADAQQIPPRFLEQILLTLRRARYVRSQKGQGGGYALAKEAGEITLAEIIRLFDGALAPTESVSRFFYVSTPIEKEKKFVRLFKKIRNEIAKTLEQTTIADMK